MRAAKLIDKRGRAWLAATLAAVAVLLAALAIGGGHRAEAGVPTYALRSIGNFQQPLYAARAPGEGDLLFVVEQEGRIQVLRDEQDLPGSFLDISDRVLSGGEQGLLSVAFAPDYQSSRRLYVYYTDRQGNIRVDEYRRQADRRLRADPTSRRRVIDVPHPEFENHNGGTVAFGPDGLLYLATGDGGGGGGGDPGEEAQDKSSLLGKLIRIDPTPAAGGPGYDVPPSNPFVDRTGLDEIYSLGLRNPFRFSIDAPSDSIAIGDVGQNAWEEIDFESLASARGASFGWDRFEGTHDFETGDPVPPRNRFPIHEYAHDDPPGGLEDNCAVTGGRIVRDPGLPSLIGEYLYADFCNGELWTLDLDGASPGTSLNEEVSSPVAFGEGPGRQLYVVSRSGAVHALEQEP